MKHAIKGLTFKLGVLHDLIIQYSKYHGLIDTDQTGDKHIIRT